MLYECVCVCFCLLFGENQFISIGIRRVVLKKILFCFLLKVSIILRKCETLRTSEESRFLESATDIVKQILTRKNRLLQSKERVLEKEDPQDVIEEKARKLALGKYDNVLS